MTRMILFSAIAAAVGLLGCAGAGTTGAGIKAALPCNPGLCIVAVTITDCAAEDGVSVDRPMIDVFESQNIQWDIVTNGYSFVRSGKQNGIVIKDYYGQFGAPQHVSNKRITVQDHHTHSGPNYYVVYVMKDDGTRCVPLDPWINNR